MAKSGSAYKAFARHRLVAEWQETSQNIANNTSNVTIRVYLQSMDGYGAMQAPASNAGNVKANGVTKNFSANSNLSANQKKLLTTQTFTIGHAADGKKTFSYSATFNINVTFAGTYYGNQTVSGSGTLNTIPRTSTISSISGNQIGGNVTVNISRASSSFTHRVGYYDTDGTRRNAIQDATTSTTFSIPMDRCSLLPNSTSGTAKIIVDTYSGSTRVGSTSKNHTMYVPTSVVPSLSSITFTESNATVKGMVNSSPTTMIQGHSSPLMALNGAAGTYGSTINQYKFTDVNGRETFHNGYLLGSGGPAVSGNRIIKGQVRDTRGRWSPERTLTVNILAYSPVRIVSFSTVRLASPATTIRVTKNATYSQIMGNTISYQLKYKKAGIGWTNTGNVNHATNQYDLTGYDVNTSYDLLLEVRDKLSVTTSSLSVPTEKKLLQLNGDKGVGIGKPHERGALDVGGDSYFNGGAVVAGNFSSKGYTTLTAGSTNSGGNDVMLHLNRTNTTPVAVFASNGTTGDFAMNLYNQNGAWTRAHLFKHNGKTELSGDLTVQYWVYAQKFVQGSQHIYTDRNKGVLWSGASWMNSDQSITLPKTIDQAPNGWILILQAYGSGAVINRDFAIHMIHKSMPDTGFHVPVYWDYGDKQAGRYMYLRNRNRLDGARTNAINSAQGGGIVLSKIVEF